MDGTRVEALDVPGLTLLPVEAGETKLRYTHRLGRVFALLDPRALAEGFRRWTLAMTQSDETLIAIDGKTLRRSFKRAGDNAFVHMVSAWSASNRVALGQVKTDDKSNEITAIPELLELIDVKDALVSIDAAGAQTAIAHKVVDKGGDYLRAVKGNQPTLHTALIEHFDGADDWVGVFGVYETQEHARGRDEQRRAWVSYRVGAIDSAERWTQLSTLIRVESTRTVQGKRSVDNRYYICSRPQLSAIEALQACAATGRSKTSCTGCSTSRSGRMTAGSGPRTPLPTLLWCVNTRWDCSSSAPKPRSASRTADFAPLGTTTFCFASSACKLRDFDAIALSLVPSGDRCAGQAPATRALYGARRRVA